MPTADNTLLHNLAAVIFSISVLLVHLSVSISIAGRHKSVDIGCRL